MVTRLELSDIASSVSIPTLPDVVARLIAIVEDPEVDIDDIAKLVAQDAPITSKLLRIANSTIYGLSRPATSALDAAKVVGARTLKNIAIQASVVAHYDKLSGMGDFDVNGLWRHSIFTAQLSQEVAIRAGVIREIPPDEFYTCGLLHDIGKMVLLETLQEEYLDVYRKARETKRPLHKVEQSELGFDHSDVGFVVASRWGLHESIGEVIRSHHGPGEELERMPRVAVVVVADQIAYRLDTATFPQAAEKLRALGKRLLDLSPAAFDSVIEWGVEALPLVEVG